MVRHCLGDEYVYSVVGVIDIGGGLASGFALLPVNALTNIRRYLFIHTIVLTIGCNDMLC